MQDVLCKVLPPRPVCKHKGRLGCLLEGPRRRGQGVVREGSLQLQKAAVRGRVHKVLPEHAGRGREEDTQGQATSRPNWKGRSGNTLSVK